MGRYIHYFKAESDFQNQYNGENYEEPWVSLTKDTVLVPEGRVDYNKDIEREENNLPNYQQHLTFDVKDSGTVVWKRGWTSYTPSTIQYRMNGSEWFDISSDDTGVTIDVAAGDILRFRGSGLTSGSTFSGTTCKFDVRGNIMSLFGWDSFSGLTEIQTEEQFAYLFEYCTGLTASDKLSLPATTLSTGCYHGLFMYCSSLVDTPELPAETLAIKCYDNMFCGCASLTAAPELVAMSIPASAYSYMFSECTSLEVAPVLPATAVGEASYYGMFMDSSVTGLTVLPAKSLGVRCYYGMFRDCTGLTEAPVLCATTLQERCYYQMFYGCTSLVTAPDLKATSTPLQCYYNMFYRCSSLNYLKIMVKTADFNALGGGFLEGVSPTGTLVRPSGGADSYGQPAGWTIVDA